MDTQSTLEAKRLRWDDFISVHPNDPRAYVQRGMAHFKLANIAESIQDFDRAEALDAAIAPYLWQRGLSYYYAGQFEAGARQFELDLTVNAQDVEETVWRYLCMAQYAGVSQARASLLPVKNDPRPFMRQIYDLFAGQCTPEEAIAGQQMGRRGQFYSHLYVGLFYEAAGEPDQAKPFITQAAKTYVIEDYMGYLAYVHCLQRQWI